MLGWKSARRVGFGVYVAGFDNYNATHGSLGPVAVSLIWLSSYVLLLGAEPNSKLEHQVETDPGADTADQPRVGTADR